MLSFESKQHQDQVLIKPIGELTIFTAAEAWKELADALETHANLTVDLGEITEIDTAGIQILVWLKQEAKHRDRTLPFVNHAPPVLEALDLLDLGAVFGDTILINPSHA